MAARDWFEFESILKFVDVMSAKINKNFTYVSVWSYPLAYPY